MALFTHTVTINAAFLREIKEDHHELRQLMHHTQAVLRQRESSIDLERLADLLSRMRDQLAMHFSLEEAYGYLDDALSDAPHLDRRAQRLRSEHGDLYQTLSGLADRADDLRRRSTTTYALAALADDFQDFYDRFQAHEQHESDLIFAALDDDLGAGD